MNILITGGLGFIGKNLIQYLLNYNYIKVDYCDNEFSSNNLNEILNIRSQKVCNDISEINLEILNKYDALIHLAAVKKHNALNLESEAFLIQTNLVNTYRLFKLATESRIKKIIFASSLYAHGDMHNLLASENDMPKPLSLYGNSKLFGENCLRELSSQNLCCIALRLHFIYGPGQYSGKGYPSVFLKSFDRLNKGLNPIIINDGKQKLDYLYINDLCELIHISLEKDLKNYFEIINASSGSSHSIEYVINEITTQWNRKFHKSFQPIYEGFDFTANTFRGGLNQKALELLQWKPKTSMQDGIARFIEWYSSKNIKLENEL
jgi:UDP-glucose 4-epimerase